MGRELRTVSPTVVLAVALGAWLAAVVSVQATATRQDNPGRGGAPSAAAQAPAASGYVGEAMCLTCHEDRAKGYHGSPHSRAADPRTPAAKRGCESCHGPGQAHVDAGGDKTKIKRPSAMTAAEVTDTCTACHNKGEHAMWDGSAHESRGISCVRCHSIHEFKSENGQLKTETQIDTCVQCHPDKVQKLNRSAHMPVREGKLQCMTCHNVHGSQNERLLRRGSSVSEACASCHTEKRGPFLWEHAPVRENCATCHDPHGSSNDRMLVAKLPMLCQRCHAHTRHPSTIYDNKGVNTNNRLFARACVACHSNIHGSNHPSGHTFAR